MLLVPVGPIKKSTFWKHVELVKQFAVVRLGDVTPDLKKDSTAMFSSQAFQEGQLHFQFMTSYSRDQSHLEDFQPHRRIFGVIGIMDCQEWKDRNLSEGYDHFVKNLDKYPTAVATRCFAFDPTENQPDDTKGLIMIPNVGNMSFYMSTMMCDFASELLNQFEMIAQRIEKLQTLESPVQSSMLMGLTDNKTQNAASMSVLPQPSVSTPDLNPPPPANLSSSRTPSPTPIPSSSTSFLKRSSTTTARSSTKTPIATEVRSPTMNRSYSASNMVGSGELSKTKRRTPGRIQKLLADFYLLAGRLPDAVSHYNQAIDMAKGTADFLWLASAMEGQICAMLLLEYLHADVGHIAPRGQTSPPIGSESPSPQTPTEPAGIINDGSAVASSVVEIPLKYDSVMQKYAKVSSTSAFPLPTLVYVEACLKVARFLLTVARNGGWNDHVVSLLVQGKLSDDTEDKTEKQISLDKQVLNKSGVTRLSIAEWTMRAAGSHIQDIPVMDQIIATNSMVTILSSIGFHRKAAFLMRTSVHIILPLLIQSRANLSTKGEDGRPIKQTGRHDKGILAVLEQICMAHGIESSPEDGLITTKTLLAQQGQYGWPELQIEILRECITVSEALPDYSSMLKYTTILLRKMYKHISKEEQIRLASTIQRIVVAGKKAGQVDSSVNYWGIDLVKSVEVVKPIPRKAVSPQTIKTEVVTSVSDGDPFIYNPFSNKKVPESRQVVLITNEFTEFKVVLTNPFGFDLELQSISLSTSGSTFEPTIASTTIPANASLTIRLTGTPKQSGPLTIRGCHIKIAGFTEQEFLIGKTFKSLEQESMRSGGKTASGAKDSKDEQAPEYVLNVIPEQPLLKIRETSLLHGALMLFEGEHSQIDIELENIGNIPVDFISLTFSDSTTTNPLPINPELPTEEVYEVELFTKGTPVFSWEGSGKEVAKASGKRINLPPGEKWNLQVNVFGKRTCNSGTIQIDYGYLYRITGNDESESSEQPSDAVFYTRQLYLPLLITVSQHLESSNWDILYLRPQATVPQSAIQPSQESKTIEASHQELKHATDVLNPAEQLLQSVHDDITSTEANGDGKHDFCLVVLDVRNIWTTPFNITFSIDNATVADQESNEDQVIHYPFTIPPISTSRITLPVRRIRLPPSHLIQPVPSVDPSKQFVVSQAPKVAPEQEKARLKMFWYREELLKRLNASWKCCSTGRDGHLQLRSSLRLTPLQLSVLQKSDIEFLVSVENSKRMGLRTFQVASNQFVDMTISIRNRRAHNLKAILRIQPVQDHGNTLKENDASNSILWQGLLHVILPEIPSEEESAKHKLPLCFLSRGRYNFLYHVEDVFTREIIFDHERTVIDVIDTV